MNPDNTTISIVIYYDVAGGIMHILTCECQPAGEHKVIKSQLVAIFHGEVDVKNTATWYSKRFGQGNVRVYSCQEMNLE